MARWLASDVPEWLSGLVFLVGLPALMVLVQSLVRRIVPLWERGRHNDAAGVMLSAAVVVYSVAIGLCVVTLWEKLDEAHHATEAEATNLAALVEGSRVFDAGVQDRIRAGVLQYNRDVIAGWSLRVEGDAVPQVSTDLDDLVTTVSGLQPVTQAQRAYVDDAMRRLNRQTELRTVAVRLATDQQLPDILWVAVLGGSIVVLGLCLTCGVRDGVLRRILLVGVTAAVGINLFLVVELNYPFYGSIRIHPDSYQNVVASLER
jgi:Arc/MetJ family transcription regulator